MDQQASATIIPFPVPARRPAQDLAQSSERLAQALRNLSVALSVQRDSTLRWRAALEDLAAKMQALGHSAPSGAPGNSLG